MKNVKIKHALICFKGCFTRKNHVYSPNADNHAQFGLSHRKEIAQLEANSSRPVIEHGHMGSEVSGEARSPCSSTSRSPSFPSSKNCRRVWGEGGLHRIAGGCWTPPSEL
jgi:hypothetical protein